MNIQSFLEHHHILRNPFAEEDAQTDPVFKDHCISSAYHPVWDKVYGDPTEPSTAFVFGPKGSGKTAMRLQIDRHLQRFNREHPDRRVYVIRYDDFNPFLDHFCERIGRFSSKRAEKVLDAWRLWDHMDAILCLGVTRLVDRVIEAGQTHSTRDDAALETADLERLDRTSARDLLLLACCYDQSVAATFTGRWDQLRRRMGYRNWWVPWDAVLAVVVALATVLLLGWAVQRELITLTTALWIAPVPIALGAFRWARRWMRCQRWAMGIRRHMRVGKREIGPMRKVLMRMPPAELASQPLPRFDRTDDRYEMLQKFQSLLERLRFAGTIVLVDRVDEPHMTGGRRELMRRFLWPLLDNKLLKHPGLGFKLMLPQELYRDMEREERDFHERARLDKQNVIPSFTWTGEALYDLARARMIACAAEGQTPEPQHLFDEAIGYTRLLAVFQSLRVPRHLFRFIYRVLVRHCNQYTDAAPEYRISQATFESELALYLRDVEP